MKVNHLKKIGLFLIFVSAIVSYISAQPFAFPGAEGFGRNTIGGRGGVVYYVTDLTDNSSNPTVGSLRYGLTKISGARTILFKVSGTITLQSDLKITNGNVTIAGQTAPGDGICLKNYTLRLNASNIIVRYIRSRMGDLTSYIDDAMDANGTAPNVTLSNIIVDHCSMSWSIDETGSFYDIKNFTLQWCILSESLYGSVDPKGNHGYAGIWGGQGATFHHNLLAHHSSRNPRFCGSRYTGDTINEIVDMRNNVIYNWGNINSSYGGEGGNYNMVNNYYKAGPATPGSTTSSTSNKRNRILNYTSYYYSTDSYIYPDTLFGGKFYVNGNYVNGFADVSADNWTKGVQPDTYSGVAALMARNKLTTLINFAPVTTQIATDAYLSVLDNVGAILPKRDTIDRRIIRETRTGTATFEGTAYSSIASTGISHPSGIIDTQNDVGAWPVLASTTAPTDTDGDGMPDAWELTNSLNPNNANDRNNLNGEGYTMLEVYLNSIGQNSVLPLTLISFNVILSNNDALLSWSTSNELNSKNFLLEKSNDGINFTLLSTIAATNSINTNTYSFADKNILTGTIFYRLKMVDKNGSFKYSNIISISNVSNTTLKVFPNPVANICTVTYPSLTDGLLQVVTVDGRIVLSQKITTTNSSQTTLNIEKLQAGTYLIMLKSNSDKQYVKFVKR